MGIIITVLHVLLVITSLLLVLNILIRQPKGGGVSDMFGGGLSTVVGSSGIAERNLNRIAIITIIIWVSTIVGLALITKFIG